MKKVTFVLLPLIAISTLLLLSECKKTNDYPSRTVPISYPVVTLNGPLDTSLRKGSTWVDPGATWKDTVTGESGTITFNINTSVDSVYYLVYTATNKNGFINYQNPATPSPVARGVAVTNMSANASIAGNYNINNVNYQAFGATSLTQRSRALFFTPNIDGFYDSSLVVIKSDSTIAIATIFPSVWWFQDYYASPFVAYVSPATIPDVFFQTSITYQSPNYYSGNPPHLTQQSAIVISFTDSASNVPSFPVTLSLAIP